MEDFKVKNFIRENPGRDFPWHEHIAGDQLDQVVGSLRDLFFVKEINAVDFISRLENMSKEVSSIYAGVDDFDLAAGFREFNIKPKDIVYINWYKFDDIDRLRFSDLCDYFDDIWYPESDDIEIFDSTNEWVVQVSHYGAVSKFIRSN